MVFSGHFSGVIRCCCLKYKFSGDKYFKTIEKSISIIRKEIFPALFFLNIFSPPQIFSQEIIPRIRIEKYTVVDGLSHNSVSGITQDKDGFIWISTYSGIDRFDGYTFRNYSCKELSGIDLYQFTDIKADNNGNIWSCAFSQFIFKYNDSLDKFDTYYFMNKIPNRALLKFFFDSRNNLWLASGSGLVYLKNGDNPNNIKHLDLGKTFMDSLIVRTIGEDKSGNLWIGCDEGFFSLTRNGDSISGVQEFRYAGKNFLSDRASMIYTMIIDNDDHLWAGLLMNGLREVDLDKTLRGNRNFLPPANEFRQSRHPGAISCDTIFCVEPGVKGKLFIRTCKGIDLFDTNTLKSIKLCTEGATKYNDIEEGNVTSALFFSKEGILWIGTLDGLYKITFEKSPFHTINNFKPDKTGLQPYKTSQVLADNQGRLWIGTQGNGLNLGLPDKSGGYTFYNFFRAKSDVAINNSKVPYGNRIYCLSETCDEKIWVSAGFFQEVGGHDNQIEFLNRLSDRLPRDFYIQQGSVNEIINMDGKLWVVYQEAGIKIYDTTTWINKELFLNNKDLRIYYPYIASDSTGRIFLRDELGLYMIDRKPLSSNKNYIPINTDTLFDFNNRYIAFPRGKFIITKADTGLWFWFPSINKGLTKFKLPGNRNSREKLIYGDEYNTGNGLSNNFIYDIIEDKNGDIWISTQNGLNRLDPETGLIRSFFTSDGLPDNRFNFGADTDKEGFLYFCNTAGVVKFHPDSIEKRPVSHNTFITRILIHNKDIREYAKLKIQSASHIIKKLNLNHKQNFLSFEFVALDYSDNRHITYQYRMDGLNNDWVNAGTRRFAEYQGIKPGKYIFRVRASEVDGSWSRSETSITIEITPPFWQRAWFYGIMVLLANASLILFIKYREKNLRARNIWLESQVKEKTDQAVHHRIELDQMKSRFFTNISHEFRTPLTLITSSAREIEKDPDGKSRLKFTGTILKAGERLLMLVNELLDLSKVEAGKLELKISESDLASSVRFIWQTYISDAERRVVKYTFNSDPEKIYCWFDPELISKIVHNLISNALKFTQREGEINIELNLYSGPVPGFEKMNYIRPPYALIRVRDTGKGISPEELSKIFDRFYQADNSNTRAYEGTGIGLSIVKELVKKHYGEIKVESEPGRGSVFSILIPVGIDHLADNEIITDPPKKEQDEVIRPDRLVDNGRSMKFSILETEKPLVLVVEDNEDLRNFLSDQLSGKFKVVEAVNGKDALEKSNEMDPDIIVSDIMMPGMDGIELCSLIKRQVTTSHIPVILLTAKADIESKLEGLKTGADDYLTKPFNEEELLIRIENLLRQRKVLKEKFFSSPLSDIPGLHNGQPDEDFLSALLKVVEANITRSNLSIDELAQEMNLGKRTLQRKIKSLTDLTLVDFIKIIRIKHAAALIASGKRNITETAYSTGFNSVSYFTKVFREVMGVSPSEYIEKR